MIKKVFVRLLFVFTISTLTLVAQKVETSNEIKTMEKESVFMLTDSLSSIKLLADKLEIKKLIQKQKVSREERLEQEIKVIEKLENLEAPAEDIYGADSWVQTVNPMKDSSLIPNTYEIDLKGFVAPIKYYRTTSNYGWRRRGHRMHHGVDLKLYTGEPVRAVFDGKVRVKHNSGRRGYGKYYIIRHTNGLETVYGHLSKHIVKAGQIVKAGDIIGLGGNTGRSTGSHLHFEARFCGIAINPQMLFDFAEGTPNMDTYTFRKYSRSSHYARKTKKTSQSRDGHCQIYKVRRGDCLTKIAAQYHTTVQRLCQANHLSKRSILKIGDKLLIQ